MVQDRIALHSLGCKVNQNEAEAMLHMFRQAVTEKWTLIKRQMFI